MSFGITAAVIGAGATIYSVNKSTKAQQSATQQSNDTMLTAQREAQAYQERLDDRAYADSAPYRAAGVNALNKLAGSADFTGVDLASEPGYQFGLAEGNRAITNSAAARGGLLSGAALKASTKYAQDYAGTKFNDAFARDQTNKNRLATLAGIGQTSVNQSNASGAALGASVAGGLRGTASAIGDNLTGASNARASSYLATGNALTGALNQGLSAWNGRNTSPTMDYNSIRNGYGSTNALADYEYIPSRMSTALPNLYD